MKDVIFPQVWFSYIHIDIISNKVNNMKSVDITVMSAKKQESFKMDVYNTRYNFFMGK